MYNILIFGCGKIGFRHLQGLNSSDYNLNILVIDNSEISLNNGKKKWEEINKGKSKHVIKWSKKINYKIKKFDLVIIATSSKNRSKYIKKISKKLKVKYWLIEKVLTQSVREAETLRNLIKKRTAFVNFSRREMIWHQRLRSKFRKKIPLSVQMRGGLWGLACNSIHFIDLVSWWTNEKLVLIDTKQLAKKWFKSKRLGFYEIKGKLFATFSRGSKLTLESNTKKKNVHIKVILNNKEVWKIDEKNGKAFSSKRKTLNGKFNFQSELTKIFIDKILTKGTCNLPTLEDSLDSHKVFISSMLSHWNKSNISNDKSLLIT